MSKEPQLPIAINVTEQPRDDGTLWVGLDFQTPFNRFVMALPPDAARQVAEKIGPEILRILDNTTNGKLAVAEKQLLLPQR